MTARAYALLDANRVGPGLLLDPSNLQLTTAIVCDGARMALGDTPQLSGESSYEIYFWSTLKNSLAGLVSFGVAQSDTVLSNFVGGDTAGKSWGFRVADGQVWNANANVSGTSVDAVVERTTLGLHLNLSPTSCTCDWTVNGTIVYTATLPNGKAWLPAISLGSTVAGDVSACVNFGQHRPDQPVFTQGWYTQAPGLPTFYLALATEAFMSQAGDSPANQHFGPSVLNPSGFSIRRMPPPWYSRGGGGNNPAASGKLKLDNSDGTFNALLGADVRDSTIVLQTINAPAGGQGALTSASTAFTASLDSSSAPDASTIDLTLRDALAAFDRPAKVRVVPPFFDAASAGKIYPIGLGAQRNVAPLLLDAPTRLYALGDAPMSNVARVADNSAPLDPYAAPPQYTPALNGAGLTLETDAVGKLTVDCSSVGDQYVIPGVADVLAGDGAFETWSGSPLHPANFAATLGSGGSLTRMGSAGNYQARILTATAWDPPTSTSSYFATTYASPPLKAGRSYRISFRLLETVSGPPASIGGRKGGIMIRSDLTTGAGGAISPNQIPIYTANFSAQNYTFSYTVPAGSDRQLYIIAAPSEGTTFKLDHGGASGTIDNVAIELVGQYVTAPPLDGITLKAAFTEILVNREGEDASVFSSADCDAIDAAAGYTITLRYEDQPNVLTMLLDAADQFGAVVFTDELGVIRVRRMTANDDGTVVAAFSQANISLDSFTAAPDAAAGLTTLFGARHNWSPSGPNDFVSDTLTVNASTRAAYSGPSQVNLSASVALAQEYAFARGAARKHAWTDDPVAVQAEINRIASLHAEKHLIRTFVAYVDNDALGIGPSVAPWRLYPNDKVTVTLAEYGWTDERMTVIGTELFPCGNKILITVRH